MHTLYNILLSPDPPAFDIEIRWVSPGIRRNIRGSRFHTEV